MKGTILRKLETVVLCLGIVLLPSSALLLSSCAKEVNVAESSSTAESIEDLEIQVEELIKQIQSIAVIPEYSDGSVGCSSGTTTFHFDVLPTGTASLLAKAPLSAFKMKAVYTNTKALPTFVDMPISKVEAEGDVLIVTSSSSELIVTAEQSVNAVLEVNVGLNSISTGYFPLYFATSGLSVSASLIASTPFSASFACNVSSTEGITEYGICYSEGNSLCNITVPANDITSFGDFSVELTSLDPEAYYYCKAYAICNGIAVYSNLISFTQPSAEGMIHTIKESAITALSVTLHGSVDTSLAQVPYAQYGFCYSDSSSIPSISDNVKYIANANEDGDFSLFLVGLTPSTKYWYRSVLKTNSGFYYGDVRSFTSLDSGDVVISCDYSSLTPISVILRGKLNVASSSYSSVVCGFILEDEIKLVSGINDDGTFSLSVTSGLFDNHKGYKYKAFARLDGNTYYGEDISFDTPEIPVITEGAIDFGLSVKWGACNLGASSPEKLGSRFAWGETMTKTSYSWSDYKWCMGSEKTLTKYNTDPEYGIVDNIMTLEAADDAANANLGGNWSMPTSGEFQELINNCKWIWTEYKGVLGCKIMSKKEGYSDKAIFLPHYGIWSDYYSSTTGYAYSSYVDVLEYSYDEEEESTYVRVSLNRRNEGLPIRPVMK